MTDAQDITPVAPPPAFRATDTSAQALDAVGLRAMAGQRRKIFDIVVAAQRRGGRDMSMREIQRVYEANECRRIDIGTVSARVNNLIAAGWLHRSVDISRPCSITGITVHPVFAMPQQVRLCA